MKELPRLEFMAEKVNRVHGDKMPEALPQLLSTALASAMVDQLPGDEHLEIAGPGLRDMTRLAESPYEIWKDILATNSSNVEQALTAYIDKLEGFREQLKQDGLTKEFEAAQKARQLLTRPS